MNPKLRVSLIGAVWCLWTPRAFSQAATPLDRGSRIRITFFASGHRRLTGTVAALARDTLWLAPGQAEDTIVTPLGAIKRLEFSDGRRSAGAGALLGGAAGLALGSIAALVVTVADGCLSGSYSPSSPPSTGRCPSAGTVWGMTLAGGAVGAGIGTVVRGERWVPFPLERVRASIAPHGVRVEIGF
jgi:hypothetical protein